MRLIFSDISTKYMKSYIDRKFTCFTFVGSGKRKKWMVGKRLKKGEFVSNGFSSNWLHFRRPKPFHMPPWYRLYGTFLTAELTCWPLSERFFRGWLERFFVEEGGGGVIKGLFLISPINANTTVHYPSCFFNNCKGFPFLNKTLNKWCWYYLSLSNYKHGIYNVILFCMHYYVEIASVQVCTLI